MLLQIHSKKLHFGMNMLLKWSSRIQAITLIHVVIELDRDMLLQSHKMYEGIAWILELHCNNISSPNEVQKDYNSGYPPRM